MNKRAMTRLGPGMVVESNSSRGQTDVRVAGEGFDAWFKDAEISILDEELELTYDDDVNEDNTALLPYDPTPQVPVEITDDTSTIQPIYEIDEEKRTSPSLSLDASVDFDTLDNDFEGYTPEDYDEDLVNVNFTENSVPHEERDAGDRYITVAEKPDFDDMQWRIDNDLESVISEYKDMVPEVEASQYEAIDLQAAMEQEDSIQKEAAWKDVAAKARRLRTSGNVSLVAANPRVITTAVEGDNGKYDCLVVRGNIADGSSKVTQWSCTCPWGAWAFKRRHKYVGRLCSHAYASLMELQSLHRNKSRSGDPAWSDNSDVQTATRYPRPDGRLSTEPGTLDTELNHIEKRRVRVRDKVAYAPPFAGSGPDSKDSWSTSLDELEENPPNLVDVTEASYFHESDKVARAIEAGRVFSLAEQEELEFEFDGKPYDRNRLDLRGTHYEV